MNEMEPTKELRVAHGTNNIRLQNLPDQLIHYIMNFLPCKDATKLSVLSKDFYSHWLSFPVLEFNYDFFRQKPDSDETFFSFIRRIIELRGPYIEDPLHKLSLSYREEIKSTNPYPYLTAFDALLDFAMQKDCKEIIFDIRITVPYNFLLQNLDVIKANVSHDSLLPLFSSKFLTVLKLTGLKFSPTVDAFITCPKLEELLILSCEGFHTINISSLSLKQVEVKCCNGLRAFQVEGPRLQSFIFEGVLTYQGLEPCDVNLPICDSLTYLHLTNVKVLAENINDVVTQFLYLSQCDVPKNLQICNPHIKVLEMESNSKVQNLVLHTPNLEGFKFKGFERESCRLDISACLALRILKLIEVITTTDGWLSSIISRLVCLKEVELVNCNKLQAMNFQMENLEKLTVYGCSNLREVVMDAPNLVNFNYLGNLGISIMIMSTKCHGSIVLSRTITDDRLWFELLTQFLSSFDHFKDLTFCCDKAEDIIFPREFVWPDKIPPLYDVKHIRFQAEDKPSNAILTPLVECLLWLAPKPATLALSFVNSGKTSILKFGYGKKVEVKKVVECCSNAPIKCWRHFVLKVKYEGFHDEAMKNCLEEFFAPYTHYHEVN